MRPPFAVVLVLLCGSVRAQEPTPEPASSTPVTAPDLAETPVPSAHATPGAAPPAPRSIGAGGSSLADIARRQKAQREREGKKASLGVISNESLRKAAAAADAAAAKAGAKPKASPTPAAHAAAAAPAKIPEWRDLKGRSEADWRKLMAGVRDRVAAADTRVKALEADARRLENDFYAWSDGNYRDRVIRPAWDQARADLATARKELDAARAEFADLEEEARKSSAPPGWLR